MKEKPVAIINKDNQAAVGILKQLAAAMEFTAAQKAQHATLST